MNYPDFSFRTSSQSFDKDAQGAHETIETFKNKGEDFEYLAEYYDAYTSAWSSTAQKGKIIAYFPEKSLVKLKYESGHEVFLDLKTQKIDDNNGGFYLHFYRKNFFPTSLDKIQELTNLFTTILQAIEKKEFRFQAPKLQNQKWINSEIQENFTLWYWLMENSDYPKLEITFQNQPTHQVPYIIRLGAYPSNLYLNVQYLPDFQGVMENILVKFIIQNPTYSLKQENI